MDVRRDFERIIDEDELPWLEQRVVALARREGWNWATIGRLLRRSRQSVRQRFGGAALVMRRDPYVNSHRQEAAFARLKHTIETSRDEEPIAW